MTCRHILVPLDFSGFSRQALSCAIPLARAHGAKISLVHVVQSPVVLRAMPDGSMTTPVNTEKLASIAKAQLDEMAAQLLPDKLRGQTKVCEGNAGYEVVAVAKSLKADLITLSTHGRSGLPRVLLGSTAERIVRHAHCSVLTVRRQGSVTPRLPRTGPVIAKHLPWRRILVPIDFSITSLRALKAAVPLAQLTGARLLLLNVVEPNPYAAGMEGAVLATPDQTLFESARKQLPRVAEKFIPKSITSTTLTTRGRAASEIIETAESKQVDLIVLSTREHTGFDRLMLGSTAEQVVRHAKCPVFVARHPLTKSAKARRN